MIGIALRTTFVALVGGIVVFLFTKLAFYTICSFGGHNTMEFLYGTTSPAILGLASALLTIWMVATDRSNMANCGTNISDFVRPVPQEAMGIGCHEDRVVGTGYDGITQSGGP